MSAKSDKVDAAMSKYIDYMRTEIAQRAAVEVVAIERKARGKAIIAGLVGLFVGSVISGFVVSLVALSVFS